MSSSVMMMVMILSLFYVWISCSTMDTLTRKSFNRKNWFDDGNIFHIDQGQFFMTFQQHRNVNRHIHWLANEISSLNRQIQSIRDQVAFIIHTREQRTNLPQETDQPISNPISISSNNNSQKLSSPSIKLKNDRNIFILKLLSNETLFDGYLEDLIDLYQFSLTTTIECVAIVIEQNSIEKHLVLKLSNGNIDKYQMNKSKSLKETLWRIDQPVLVWNNDGQQPEYYQRFTQNSQSNEMITTDQLIEIKNRPKLNDVHFFDMMGQILRIKYHTDPSSLSCILEVFFGNIYTCDGRLIHPHELKLLSDNNDHFVFYAVMMDTTTEKQIYPLDTNNHIRTGEQIFFLFHTHPQYQSLSSLTCADCPRYDQTYVLNTNQKELETTTDNQIIEPQESVDNLIENSFLTIPQNYIVYAVVTSILIYILFSIYPSRREESTECLGRKHSISSRRGR